jgi:hypothetical protein
MGQAVDLRCDSIDGGEGTPRVHSRTYNMEVKGEMQARVTAMVRVAAMVAVMAARQG